MEINTIKDCYKARGDKNIHQLIALKESLISDKKYGLKMSIHNGYLIHTKHYEPFNK